MTKRERERELEMVEVKANELTRSRVHELDVCALV